MKGMELAKAYFEEYGIPMIETSFSQYQGQIAAGLVGEGSECLGYDDEFSQDHDFGPGFCCVRRRDDRDNQKNER